MNVIPTRVHGIIDYILGIVLIVTPFALNFRHGAPMWVMVCAGVVLIVYSLLTDYEVSAVRAIPMPVHLVLDVIGGIFVAISPWLFGFAAVVFWPHLILGIFEIVIAALSSTHPAYSPLEGHRGSYVPREHHH
jgi:hypothetical protein